MFQQAASLKKFIKRSLLKITGCPLPLSFGSSDDVLCAPVKVLTPDIFQHSKVFCNLNFDDQCPVHCDSQGRDFGGNPSDGLAVRFKEFLQACPYVAVTSFVIPHFLGNRRGNVESKISHNTNREWLVFYNCLAEQYNIEYALHGCYHHQKENRFFSRHTEFAFKNQAAATSAINQGLSLFADAGWHAYGFRQPGWDINGDLSICSALKRCGLKYISGSSLDAGFNSGGVERVSNYYPTVVNGIINFPQNIELDWELDRICSEIDRLYDLQALISIKGHFADKNVCNCLSQKNLEKLTKVASYINKKYKDSVEFITFADLAKKYAKCF